MVKLRNPINGRYYYLDTIVDLFKDTVLIIIRGGNKKNLIKCKAFTCQHTLQKEIDSLIKRRLQRGYNYIT